VLVFDATAIASVFSSYGPTWALWKRANDGRLDLVFPVCAIVEAAGQAKVRKSAWDLILWPPSIKVMPLEQSVAVEIGEWSGTFGARHALWEAMAMECPIVTRDPSLYGDVQVEVREL
jgi:hypothetical protein